MTTGRADHYVNTKIQNYFCYKCVADEINFDTSNAVTVQ